MNEINALERGPKRWGDASRFTEPDLRLGDVIAGLCESRSTHEPWPPERRRTGAPSWVREGAERRDVGNAILHVEGGDWTRGQSLSLGRGGGKRLDRFAESGPAGLGGSARSASQWVCAAFTKPRFRYSQDCRSGAR